MLSNQRGPGLPYHLLQELRIKDLSDMYIHALDLGRALIAAPEGGVAEGREDAMGPMPVWERATGQHTPTTLRTRGGGKIAHKQ